MYRFYLKVFGCPMRAIEAERVRRYLLANNCVAVPREKADIIGVFGCSIIYATDNLTLEYKKHTQ